MPHFYQYNDAGEKEAIEYEGDRLPSPGHYRYIKGEWWKLDKPQIQESAYIAVGDGVKSPLDDKVYTNGYAYADHAKAQNAQFVGNDFASNRQARQERMAERAEQRRAQHS